MFVLTISSIFFFFLESVVHHGLCTFVLESYAQVVHVCCQFIYERDDNEDRYKMLANYNRIVEPLQKAPPPPPSPGSEFLKGDGLLRYSVGTCKVKHFNYTGGTKTLPLCRSGCCKEEMS